MNALKRANEQVPNWVRAVVILLLPALAYWAATQKAAVPSAIFVVWSLLTLFLHVPALLFDGPLPVSVRGVHHRGEIYPWDQVASVRPRGEKDLEAVLADEQLVPLRLRGQRNRDEVRAVIAQYKPAAINF